MMDIQCAAQLQFSDQLQIDTLALLHNRLQTLLLCQLAQRGLKADSINGRLTRMLRGDHGAVALQVGFLRCWHGAKSDCALGWSCGRCVGRHSREKEAKAESKGVERRKQKPRAKRIGVQRLAA